MTTNFKSATNTASEPLLLKVEDVIRLLQFSRSTIYKMMDRGELPFLKYGTARRIPRAAVESWINERATSAE